MCFITLHITLVRGVAGTSFLQGPEREAKQPSGLFRSDGVKAAAESGRRPADREAIRVTPLSSTNKDVQFQQKFISKLCYYE